MYKKSSRFMVLTTLAVSLILFTFAPSAQAQWTVNDPINAALNIEQLARQAQEIAQLIQQVQNQIRGLENQARMLQNLNLSDYSQAIGAMQRLQNILKQHCIEIQAQGGTDPIGFDTNFDCQALMDRFRQAYPTTQDWNSQSDEQLSQYPDQWNAQQRGTAAHAIQVQNAAAGSMDGTQQRMAELAQASADAPGQKAALQATNQILIALGEQLRQQQVAELATQRLSADQKAQEAAEDQRNQELIRRASRDAATVYDLSPVDDPFGG